MRVYVLVKCFQGIVESVEISNSEKELKKAFKEYTGYDYNDFYKDNDAIDEKYDQTKIFEVDLPEG